MSRKDRMAAEDRERRDYDETYGRGGGDRFAEEEHPHGYGAPGSHDWRRAMRAYVDGHDRGWSADRKHREAAERPEAPVDGDGGGEGPPGARPEPRFGVGVPDRSEIRFHRAASTWRDRLPSAERLPRHTDRRLDGQRGRGDQA